MKGRIPMRLVLAAGAGALLGSVAMFVLDPGRGRRRRRLLRDVATSRVRRGARAMMALAVDARNRCMGEMLELRARATERRVDEDILAERVRAELGRCLRHPHWVAVQASDGRVVLRGSIVSGELSTLLESVGHVRGVRAVEQYLLVAPASGASV
jgi:osmotically-inducible protein OsmY